MLTSALPARLPGLIKVLFIFHHIIHFFKEYRRDHFLGLNRPMSCREAVKGAFHIAGIVGYGCGQRLPILIAARDLIIYNLKDQRLQTRVVFILMSFHVCLRFF